MRWQAPEAQSEVLGLVLGGEAHAAHPDRVATVTQRHEMGLGIAGLEAYDSLGEVPGRPEAVAEGVVIAVADEHSNGLFSESPQAYVEACLHVYACCCLVENVARKH